MLIRGTRPVRARVVSLLFLAVPLKDRFFFSLAAGRAAEEELAKPEVRKRATAYQLFISDNYAAFLARTPNLTLGELTAQFLAPAWNALPVADRKAYEQRAASDTERWRREQDQAKANAPKIVFENVRQVAETITSAPLSGQGLFVAANWDSGSEGAMQTDPSHVWTELDASAQQPWKEKALRNQKQFALDAMRPKNVARNKKTNKRVKKNAEE